MKKHKHDAAKGKTLRVFGIILLSLGIFWLIVARTGQVDAPILVLNWHIPAILLGLFLMYRGKRFVSRSRPADLIDDPRPPVIYLRPFKKDASTAARVLPGMLNPVMLLATFTTFEEQLVEAIKPIGPLVALAQPHSALPRPGAARYQASDKDWESLVINLLKKARLVIIRPGSSDSVVWELDKAFEILRPDQLLLLFHNTSKKEYQSCSSVMKDSHGILLPEKYKRDMFVAFDNSWNTKLLPFKMPYFRRSQIKPYKRLIHHALEPLFRSYGIEWHPMPLSKLTIASVSILVLMFLFFMAVLIFN